MGNRGTKSKTSNKTEVNKENNQKEKPTKNNQNNMHQTHLSEFDPETLKELSKVICRIDIKTREGKKTDIGFFLKFLVDFEPNFFLITTDHIINNESINNNDIIYLYNEKLQTINIKLDKNKRYIKSFKDNNLDITVVEILYEDKIPKEHFLKEENDISINNKLLYKEIYIPIYSNGLKLKKAERLIKDIVKYEFSFSADI